MIKPISAIFLLLGCCSILCGFDRLRLFCRFLAYVLP